MNKDLKEKGKEKKKPKNVDNILIASYAESYSPESLKQIKSIINRERPEKIIILKIIKERTMKKMVDATMGVEEKKDFLESVLEEKKKKADEYAEGLIKMTDRLDIPTEVHLRKGETISTEIIEEIEKVGVDHLIIHSSEDSALDKMLEESVVEKIKSELNPKKITAL